MKKRLSLIVLMLAAVLLMTACGSEPEGPQEFAYVLDTTGEWARLVRYQGEAEEVVLPETLGGKPLKEIGEDAFASAPFVTSITIPASVTKIGDPSFSALPKLAKIAVAEDSVGFLVQDDVLYHKKIKTIYCYPQGKTGDSFTLPDSITTIGAKAFYNAQLKTVTMGDKVTKILAGAFENSANLESVTLSAKLSQIYERAFSGCVSLKSVALPDSLTSIAAGAFRQCASLEEISVPAGVGVLDAEAFDGCTAMKKAVIAGTGIQRVSAATFRGCTSLESVAYAAELLGVGEGAFQGCESLKEFRLTDSLTTLERSAFQGCASLTELYLPESLSVIGAHALDGTGYLDSLEGDIVVVGNGVVVAVRGATEVVLPETVKAVSFLNSDVTKVTVPEGVTALCDGAFQDCAALADISLPASLTQIGKEAFAGCVGLRSFTVPAGVSAIGDGCFTGCSGIEAFQVASGNATFGVDQGVLYDNSRKYLIWYPQGSANTSYTVPFGPILIADGAFRGASNLETVDCSKAQDVLRVGEYAFADCPKLKSVRFTDNFTTIGAHAFENDAALSDFKLTYSMNNIGERAFAGCSSLGNQEISGALSKIGKGAFEGTTGVYKVQANTLGDEFVKTWALPYKR